MLELPIFFIFFLHRFIGYKTLILLDINFARGYITGSGVISVIKVSMNIDESSMFDKIMDRMKFVVFV